MSERTRAGIATKYAGVQFRSRLEAKWAYFFDLLEWRWEYEPFDANGYIPDFVLIGNDPVVVEVKPAVTERDFDSATTKAYDALAGEWEHDILFVGVTPFFASSDCWNADWPTIGLVGEREPTEDGKGTWWTGIALWNDCGYCGELTFVHDFQCFRSRRCGHYSGDHYMNQPTHNQVVELDAKWRYATNAVQWHKR